MELKPHLVTFLARCGVPAEEKLERGKSCGAADCRAHGEQGRRQLLVPVRRPVHRQGSDCAFERAMRALNRVAFRVVGGRLRMLNRKC